MCLLTNERYKTYQTGFSFGRLGHAPGVGLGGSWGQFFFSEIQPDLVCELLESVTYIRHCLNGICNGTIFGGPLEGPKCQISLNLNYKVNFKDF